MNKSRMLHVKFLPSILPSKVRLMKKSRSVQSTLRIAFFIMLIVLFLFYMSYYVLIETGKIKDQAYNSVKQNVTTASSFVDSNISSLDTVMQNIAYSNLVKEQYAVYLNTKISSDDGNYTSMQNSKILTNLLTAIIGPNRPVDQIYLYALDKGSFGIGLDNTTSDASVQNFDFYGKLLENPRNKLVFCDYDERLEKYFSYKEGSQFLTLCSVYQSDKYKPNGVIEVKRSISPLIEQLKTIDTGTYQQNIYIYDPEGRPVYFSTNSSVASQKYAVIKNMPADSLSNGVGVTNTNGEHFFAMRSAYSGFVTLICISNTNLYRPILLYVRDNILIFLFFALFSFAMTYIVSKIITTPLMKMYSQLQSLHTAEDMPATEETMKRIDTSIIELDTLYSALINMHERAQNSMKREMILHNQNLQSRMLALQSQMNPHFLFNSLATIQSMADEGMNTEIVEMCQTISRILRYISSNSDQLVTIQDDLSHACDYLACMKMRYDDDLDWEIDVPSEMMDIRIPKLCLELIIENSIKFSTKSVRPPWKIRVRGTITDTFWEISIEDNGAGFEEEDMKNLNEKIAHINETDLLPNLGINGMGLMNIYIRFKILYHERHIFRISNIPSGGACVTIGGEISQAQPDTV